MMRFEVIIQEPAYADLQDIFAYIAEFSPFVAEQVLDELIEVVGTLETFPERHTRVVTVGEVEIRQLVFKKNFRVLYTIKGQEVHILHCFRCERDFEELF